MTRKPAPGNARNRSTPVPTLRLRLKPQEPRSGYVDGAWWPHSDDLTAELPDLLAALTVRLGAIARVVYNHSEWGRTPTKLINGDRTVQLDCHRPHPPNTIEVRGINREAIALLVVPHCCDPSNAHAAVTNAAAPNSTATVDTLLGISVGARQRRTLATDAQQRWLAFRKPARVGG